jgi:3-phosphoshikimate 1-carboxyvinyltransferase
MERVAVPLSRMGAEVRTAGPGTPPVEVVGRRLPGGEVTVEVPSAQVKTALLLAGLQADGVTSVTEAALTRDHTERLLRRLGVDLEVGRAITLRPPAELEPFQLSVPGDPSSAAFWAVLGACHPDADLLIRGVCLNPTRTGFLAVLRRMGAEIQVTGEREEGGEPVGDLGLRSSRLRATDVGAEEVPSMVDELPVLAVAAATAEGTTRFRGLNELRHKEVDRLAAIREQLAALGASVAVEGDDLVVEGPARLSGATVASMGDHRMAMSLAIAGCLASGETLIEGAEAADVSYPGFFAELARLAG